ncbi:MAG: hypothetical protein FJ104_09345, partial [Deltaproteobacteria bacterium]|nr:hypothetical protein [Deltaproteobacteria bacterium]
MTQADKKQLGRIALQQRAVPQGGGEAPVPLVERLKALSEQTGVPAIDLSQICIHTQDLDFVPVEIARQHVILPVLLKGDRLFVAMASPSDQRVIDELEFVTDKKVFPYVALRDALVEVIDSAYAARRAGEEYFTGPDCP